MRRSVMVAAGAALLLAGLTTATASADPGPECPRGNPAVGVLCHERSNYDPASHRPHNRDERLVLVRACVDIRAGRLLGIQTGFGPLDNRDDLIKIELQCQREVPPCPPVVPAPTPDAPVVVVVPPQDTTPPAGTAANGSSTVYYPAPPTAGESLVTASPGHSVPVVTH